MAAQCTQHSAGPACRDTRGRQQVQRRRRLGLLLIALGSVWLLLRLAGWIGDAPVPLMWVQWVRAPEQRIALPVLQAAGAVLALYSIGRAWVSHAEQ